MPDAIVIGAGVVGSAVAYALAEGGAQVAVLEAGKVAAGTSAATFAVDVSRFKTPRVLFDLCMAGAREHERLAQERDGGHWFHRAVSLEWEGTETGRQLLHERVQRLQEWGYPTEWVSAECARELEPALALPAHPTDRVALYRKEVWYDASTLARWLLRRAQQLGAVVRQHEGVTAIKAEAGHITEVTTATGRRISGDLVVDCAGAAAGSVAALAGANVPVRRVPGLLVTSSPSASGLRTIVSAADLHARPHHGRRVLLHSWVLDGELALEPPWPGRHALAQRLLNRARPVLPGLGVACVEAARVGVRPIPPDGLPLVGFVPEVDNLYAVVSHSGVHLAPILGQLAARELAGRPQERLESFRPARFLTGDGPPHPLDESTSTMLAQMTATHGRERQPAE